MGLILPSGPSWSHWTDNFSASTPATQPGTTVVAGASNADGSAVTLLSALAHDAEYLVIGINGGGASATNSDMLLDILIDPAGGTSWASLIDDLLAGFCVATATSLTMGMGRVYHFPLWIPAGASIGAQARTANGSTLSPRVQVYAAGGNRNPASWWCGQKVTTVGVSNAASSQGQAHTPGNSGAFSTWTDLGSALAKDAGAVQWAVQGQTAAPSTWVGQSTTFEFGVGGTRIGPAISAVQSSGELLAQGLPCPIFYNFPSGAQLQVRATSSTTATACDVGAYVVH